MVTAALSPHYAEQGTPDVNGSSSKHAAFVTRPLSLAHKLFLVAKVLSAFLGSVLFQIGSIYFYPKFSILWDGKGGIFGAWAFVVGCGFFFITTNLSFVETIAKNTTGSATHRVLVAYNALMYVMAGVIFVLGALYFLPELYPKAPALGCWAFLLGSIQFCLAALGDIAFIVTTHADPKQTGVNLGNLRCWGTVAALGTFIGAFLFILGSWYYLPRFIAQEDVALSESYMYKSINFYTTGSVFFIINSLALVPDMLAEFKAGVRVPVSKEGADHI